MRGTHETTVRAPKALVLIFIFILVVVHCCPSYICCLIWFAFIEVKFMVEMAFVACPRERVLRRVITTM